MAKQTTRKSTKGTKKRRPGRPSAADKKRDERRFLDGMEPVFIDELDLASRKYADDRDARIKKSGPEKESKALLIELMKKHDLTLYESRQGLKTEVIPGTDKVKVEPVGQPSGADD